MFSETAATLFFFCPFPSLPFSGTLIIAKHIGRAAAARNLHKEKINA
jgi:hypothetical protein